MYVRYPNLERPIKETTELRAVKVALPRFVTPTLKPYMIMVRY